MQVMERCTFSQLFSLHDPRVAEVNVSEGQEVSLFCVWTAGVLDKLLQVTLSQLLVQFLNHLPSVLEDKEDIIFPTATTLA